ncbi:MAG: hypothetical protein N4A41_03480 [Crocinitomicaceae bacterium]|nr:hypothetical protein [Crocinitomicaceae bacterium]
MLLFLVAGCTSNVGIRVLEPYPMFHGNASKIWIINKVLNKGKNYSPTPIYQKDCIIFHKNEKFQMQPIHTLGYLPQKSGTFYVEEEGKFLTLSGADEEWKFEIKLLQLDKIKLQPLPGSSFEFELELITYPSPQ